MALRLSLLVLWLALVACTGPETLPDKRTVIAHTLATTIQLFAEREGGVRRAGSAVVLAIDDADGETVILTTAHLLEPPVKQSVTVFDEVRQSHIPAKVVAVDPEIDLALVTAVTANTSQVDLATGAELADEILIVAFPWGRKRTVVNGAVSQITSAEPREHAPPIWGAVRLVDASVSYGMSGGGVFDRRTGQLIGIVRGYRTVHLSLSSEPAPLKLPIAGESTIIPAIDIVCFLRANDFEHLVPSAFANMATPQDCVPPT